MRPYYEGFTHEALLTFCCEWRGIFPSCGTRRIAETAAYLVDGLIARVPMCQLGLSFSSASRRLFAMHLALPLP